MNSNMQPSPAVNISTFNSHLTLRYSVKVLMNTEMHRYWLTAQACVKNNGFLTCVLVCQCVDVHAYNMHLSMQCGVPLMAHSINQHTLCRHCTTCSHGRGSNSCLFKSIAWQPKHQVYTTSSTRTHSTLQPNRFTSIFIHVATVSITFLSNAKAQHITILTIALSLVPSPQGRAA